MSIYILLARPRYNYYVTHFSFIFSVLFICLIDGCYVIELPANYDPFHSILRHCLVFHWHYLQSYVVPYVGGVFTTCVFKLTSSSSSYLLYYFHFSHSQGVFIYIVFRNIWKDWEVYIIKKSIKLISCQTRYIKNCTQIRI